MEHLFFFLLLKSSTTENLMIDSKCLNKRFSVFYYYINKENPMAPCHVLTLLLIPGWLLGVKLTNTTQRAKHWFLLILWNLMPFPNFSSQEVASLEGPHVEVYLTVRAVWFKGWSTDQQHQHHLRTCQNWRTSGTQSQNLCFNKVRLTSTRWSLRSF